MPLITYDNRSFSIDGRRVWLVSGSVHYTRIPRDQWRDRLRAAREAGLNCVEVPVVWSAHEVSPETFDFEGDRDLRGFIKTAAEEGLYCIVRPGPYIGDGYDMGGLPAYLHGVTGKKETRVKFRENEPLFLEAVDRYFRAVMEQVGDLQVASPGQSASSSYHYVAGSAAGGYQGEGGGPIVMMQVEHAWESHNPEQLYLERLVSMLRQHGCEVPLTNANNLWQPVEGTIDTWRGEADLPAMMRQLGIVQTEAPPIVSHFYSNETASDADTLAYRLAGLIGVGAQFNLSPFHTGVMTSLLDGHRPMETNDILATDGSRGDAYRAVKRLSTFVSQFGSILAHREAQSPPTVSLNESDHPAALLHQRSSQGELIVLIKSAKDKSKQTELMLGNGLSLDVPHAGQRAAIVLLNASLGGRTVLDYTSLSPWAIIDRKLLVVYGPAGSTGQLSIDGQHHTITVPTGKSPDVIQADPLNIAVLNQEQIDAAYRSGDGLVVGCDGFDLENNPKPLKGWGTRFTITPDGDISRKRVTLATKPTAPKLKDWQALSLRTFVDGTDERYQSIQAPAPLGEFGQSHGYGWYRVPSDKGFTGKVLPHIGGDRLHIYQKGKLAGLFGTGEGAEQGGKPLKLASETVVFADALGRCSEGQGVGTDPKGLPDHLYAVKPIKVGKPVVTQETAGDPFEVTGYVYHQRADVRPMSDVLTWEVKPESRKPIVLEFDGLEQACVVRVNGEPIYFKATHTGTGIERILLDPAQTEAMTGGKNAIRIELLEPLRDGVKMEKHVRFYQTTGSTPKDGWAYAPWSIPASDDAGWRSVPKSLPSQPSWFCASFDVQSQQAPLCLTIEGMSKGHIVLNGHDLGRFWLQTREGKIVADQQQVYLPEGWLKTDESNLLMLFDEHGRTPEKCDLAYTGH